VILAVRSPVWSVGDLVRNAGVRDKFEARVDCEDRIEMFIPYSRYYSRL